MHIRCRARRYKSWKDVRPRFLAHIYYIRMCFCGYPNRFVLIYAVPKIDLYI